MVTPPPERKARAEYSLDRVRVLAGRQSIWYAGTRVQVDIANLGYGLDDVCGCLRALRVSDFHHSERFTPNGRWHDVYRTTWRLPGEPADDLYVKFRLDDNVLIIELCSFHPPRKS